MSARSLFHVNSAVRQSELFFYDIFYFILWTGGRISPEVSLNLQEICENADTISLLFVTFVYQNERVIRLRQFNATQNNNHGALMFC